jgi:hypothetical protein
MSIVEVLIGTPISRNKSYAIDKFLANQKEIQKEYPSSELVLATCERDFVDDLNKYLGYWGLRGKVLSYEVKKPDYARSLIWNITCAREAIRQYTVLQTEAVYLLSLDADMTFDPSVVAIMKQEINDCDVVFGGAPLRHYGTGLAGAGCAMLTRSILEKLKFRCYEFRNGEIIFEDNVLEMDLFRLGAKVKKGFFVSISHYESATEVKTIKPQRIGLARRLTNSTLIRYNLIRISILIHYNIPWRLKVVVSRLPESKHEGIS